MWFGKQQRADIADLKAALAAQSEQIARLESALPTLGRLESGLAGLATVVGSTHQFLGARLARPYYCLADGWGLTHLNTGQPFYVNTRDNSVTPWILMGGHWETNVENVLLSYAAPGMHVVDIGAHCGYYTVKLGAKIGQSGRLVSVEPNPEMNKYLEQNIVINGLLFMTDLRKCALGAEPGKANLSYSGGNLAQANLLAEQPPEFSFEVVVDTLDNALAGTRPVDLIKLDAEGFEPMILKGAQKTIERSPECAIMLELSKVRWERVAKLEDLPRMVGAQKIIFAVTLDGKLRKMAIGEVGGFLDTCAFNENYFFFCPPTPTALGRIEHLVVV